jgi:hypothetical protein
LRRVRVQVHCISIPLLVMHGYGAAEEARARGKAVYAQVQHALRRVRVQVHCISIPLLVMHGYGAAEEARARGKAVYAQVQHALQARAHMVERRLRAARVCVHCHRGAQLRAAGRRAARGGGTAHTARCSTVAKPFPPLYDNTHPPPQSLRCPQYKWRISSPLSVRTPAVLTSVSLTRDAGAGGADPRPEGTQAARQGGAAAAGAARRQAPRRVQPLWARRRR